MNLTGRVFGRSTFPVISHVCDIGASPCGKLLAFQGVIAAGSCPGCFAGEVWVVYFPKLSYSLFAQNRPGEKRRLRWVSKSALERAILLTT